MLYSDFEGSKLRVELTKLGYVEFYWSRKDRVEKKAGVGYEVIDIKGGPIFSEDNYLVLMGRKEVVKKVEETKKKKK